MKGTGIRGSFSWRVEEDFGGDIDDRKANHQVRFFGQIRLKAVGLG